MPTTTQTVPQTTPLTDLSATVARRSNGYYQMWYPIWLKLAHVREGTGGFLNGTYLVEHPREYLDHSSTQVTTKTNDDGTTRQVSLTIPNMNPQLPSPKLLRRRRLARYENFGGKILDQMRAALFREEPIRRVGTTDKKTTPDPIQDWWRNIDRKVSANGSRVSPQNPQGLPRGAARTAINKFWPQAWDAAGTFGHMFIVMDRPKGTPGTTQADQLAPFLRMYTPLDAIDWLIDDLGHLVAIMFVERAQRQTMNEIDTTPRYRLRVFTDEYWALYDSDMTLLEGGPQDGLHLLGRIPVVTLYAKRRSLVPLIGHSVLDDPQLYIDLYNLTSELRELLRNQTFGLLNVILGAEESVQDAQQNMGRMSGTESVIFSHGKAEFISPDAANVDAYRNERSDLIRSIYRLSAISWESDSRDAEAKGSLKLKREDLNQMLSAFADELERAENEVAELFYRATYGAEAWEQRFTDDQVVIRYPETFDATPFDVLLAQAEAALALGMPPTFTKELRKRLVGKFLPDSPQDLIDTINAEIDAGTQEQSPMQQALAARMGAGGAKAGLVDPNQAELDKLAQAKTTDGPMVKEDAAAA